MPDSDAIQQDTSPGSVHAQSSGSDTKHTQDEDASHSVAEDGVQDIQEQQDGGTGNISDISDTQRLTTDPKVSTESNITSDEILNNSSTPQDQVLHHCAMPDSTDKEAAVNHAINNPECKSTEAPSAEQAFQVHISEVSEYLKL